MVLNIIFTPGGLESLDQGIGIKILFLFITIAIIFIEIFIFKISKNIKINIFKKLIFLLLFFLIIDKTFSAYATIKDIVWITKNMKVFPFYQPLKIRSFAEKYFGIKAERDYIPQISDRKGKLNYPKKNLEIKANFLPNIIFIVVDSIRFDMLSSEITPNIYSFAKKENAFIFKNHYSGGNATRFGIFSIFYGIYGNYWFDILGERKSPVFLDILQKLDYDIGIFASARLTYPEFDRTCFVNIPYSKIYDKPEGDKVEKDKKITEKAIEFIKTKRKYPFFSFIFYDSTHGSYDYPKELEKFKPSADGVDHLLLSPEKIKPIFNRYKNSVHFCDWLSEKILKTLKEEKILDKTIIVITGDHGEPFFERGYYGHNQNYSDYEIKVPLILYIPKQKGKEINLMTSHLDIVPTLMNILGISNSYFDYSNGIPLLKTDEIKKRKFVTCFSWDTAAIITGENTIRFPLEGYRIEGIKIYDSKYTEIKDKNIKNKLSPIFIEFSRESFRFYK